MSKQELTPEYIKSLTMLWSTKEYNEFSEEELQKVEDLMIRETISKNSEEAR
tara:strand:- start:557 stop:712 length:156 start_codon:yes stop_codon:yes gene_type:complete